MVSINFHDRETDLNVNADQLCDDKGELFILNIYLETVSLSFYRDSIEQIIDIGEAIDKAIKDLIVKKGRSIIYG